MKPYRPYIRSEAEHMIACLRDRDDKLCQDAANELESMRAERLKLSHRIHQQRVALRENWEIVEMRCQNWMGSREGRSRFINLLKRHHEILRQLRGFQEVRSPWWCRWL